MIIYHNTKFGYTQLCGTGDILWTKSAHMEIQTHSPPVVLPLLTRCLDTDRLNTLRHCFQLTSSTRGSSKNTQNILRIALPEPVVIVQLSIKQFREKSTLGCFLKNMKQKVSDLAFPLVPCFETFLQ